MNILFAASEVFPFVKTGGLADVAYSLPKELVSQGVKINVILPKYKSIDSKWTKEMKFIKYDFVQVGWRSQYCGLFELKKDNINFYFLDNEYYFNRDGVYGYYDDGERYAFFSKAILEFISKGDIKTDLIHCNDWQTAIIPVLYNAYFKNIMPKLKTILTIHNLKFQGIYGKDMLGELFGLDNKFFNGNALEFYDCINILKGGINYCDYITTVSPTYAKEIQTQYFGEKLDGVLRNNQNKLSGIVNGIDYELFDPKKDKDIYFNYNVKNIFKIKPKNKLELQKQLGLPQREEAAIICLVTRLTEQKGIDLITCILHELLNQLDVQFIVLGTGEKLYEDSFNYFQFKYPNKVRSLILFDHSLAQKIYAGSDIYLMPSRFEPCGISQLIALRYGCVPIVRETGGLKDTITPYNKFENIGTGFSFSNYNAHEMLFKIKEAVNVYNSEKIKWQEIIKRGMRGDYSWKNSAQEYLKLYKELIK